jgi:Na+-translocating ferredoxin:NAD+ oxidoreductase RNF subunit RnfB
MTNQNIRRSLVAIIALALVFPLVSVEAFVPLKLKPDLFKVKVKNTEEFCSKFSDTEADITKRLGEQQTKVTGYLDEHKDTLKENRDVRDADLDGNRDKADQRREEWYARLEDKADSDTEKDAVVVFKQTIESAVDTRREAVDTAIEAFRKGVDDAIAGRKSSMQSTRDDFKTAVETAIAKVKTDCDNGEKTATIRSSFKASLKAAREKLSTDKKDVDKVGKQVKALAEVRRVAVKKALDQFEVTRQAAIATLKDAFGE